MTLRRTVKTALELALTASGAAAVARRARTGSVAVLAYHNVVPDGEAGRGDASLHIPFSRFLRQLDRLAETHEIVALGDVGVPERRRRPRAVITFDDAYRGAVTLALPELRRRGLPGTVFVAPALLGEAGLWWDELAEAGRLSSRERDTALEAHQGRLETVRRWAFPDGQTPAMPANYGIATADELAAACGDGITVGGHGWGHAWLPGLERGVLSDELARTLDWIRRFRAPALPWLALPYGAGTPAVLRAAVEAGFDGILEIRGGLWRPGSDRRSVPRINVPAGLSVRGLELRASGVAL